MSLFRHMTVLLRSMRSRILVTVSVVVVFSAAWWIVSAIAGPDQFGANEANRWSAHSNSVSFLHYANGGKLIVSFGLDRRVKLWNAKNGKPIDLKVAKTWVVDQCTVSPDGKRLAVATSDGIVHIVDLNSRTETVTLEKTKGTPVSHLFFAADGSRLGVFCSAGHSLFVWKTKDWSVSFKTDSIGRLGGGRAFAFGPVADTVLTSTIIQDEVEEWNLHTSTCVHKYKSEDDKLVRRIDKIVAIPAGKIVVSTWVGRVAEWDTRTKTLTRWVQAHPTGLGFNDLAISANGKFMATAQSFGGRGNPPHVCVREMNGWKMIAYVPEMQDPAAHQDHPTIDSVALNHDGKSLAIGYGNGRISVLKIGQQGK